MASHFNVIHFSAIEKYEGNKKHGKQTILDTGEILKQLKAKQEEWYAFETCVSFNQWFVVKCLFFFLKS